MSTSWKFKSLATLIAILGSIYLLVPSFFDLQSRVEEGEDQSEQGQGPSFLKFFPKKRINLGLDLRGGMYLEMSVDFEEAMEHRLDSFMVEMERLTGDKEKIQGLKLKRIEKTHRIQAEMPGDQQKKFLNFLRDYYSDTLEVVDNSNPLELKLVDDYLKEFRDFTLSQAQEAVRNRIDRYGVVEPSIQRKGETSLIIELPGIQDKERIIEIIQKTGVLEFRLVDESIDSATLAGMIDQVRKEKNIPAGYSKDIVDQINLALLPKLPKESEILFMVTRDPITKNIIRDQPMLIQKKVYLTGDMLKDAKVSVDTQKNEPYVGLSFNKEGAKNLAQLTKEHVGERLAIILDGFVNQAPQLREEILNGEASITLGLGNYNDILKEARDLALVLREGALPASLKLDTRKYMGPSLGRDSIKKGLTSLFIAAIVIMIFMILYYKVGGFLAVVALLLNVMFLFAILCLFGAALTLPGMAGIVLTLGMAVDANIIIFERMREEKRLGKTAKAVVDSGYGNAMSAIIDANITTLIAGIVLYQFGTGPIKGFATTLIIGILTTMFTAVVVTRLVYDYFIIKRKVQKVII